MTHKPKKCVLGEEGDTDLSFTKEKQSLVILQLANLFYITYF